MKASLLLPILLAFCFLSVSCSRTAMVQAQLSNCPGANPNDSTPDDAALQSCLNNGGTILLDPGNPGYIIAQGLTLTVSGTVLGSTQAPTRATLIAALSLHARVLYAPNGVVNYRIDSILIDGNRSQRDASVCIGYRDPFAANGEFRGSGFTITNVESTRTLCGSSFVVNGSDFEISNSSFHDNGVSSGGGPEPFSDGITAGLCTRGYIHNNTFINNTDVDIVDGGGQNCRIENNTIQHPNAHAFAGIAVANFRNGDHTGSVFQNNTISSAPNMLSIGLSVGMLPWGVGGTRGGTITNNSVTGSNINLAVDGYSNGTVNNNTLSNPQGGCATNYTVSAATNVCLQPGWRVASVDTLGNCTATGESIMSVCSPSSDITGQVSSR